MTEVTDLIDRQLILGKLESYDLKNAKIGVMASHSALDVCDGAVEEGFRTLAVCEEGREQTYTKYFKAYRNPDGSVRRGMVDEAVMVKKFKETISKRVMDRLTTDSAPLHRLVKKKWPSTTQAGRLTATSRV